MMFLNCKTVVKKNYKIKCKNLEYWSNRMAELQLCLIAGACKSADKLKFGIKLDFRYEEIKFIAILCAK